MRQRRVKLSWDNLYQMWKNCTRCDLHKHRSRVVLGKGPKNADIFLIGQAPGKTEDKLGKPFVNLTGEVKRISDEMNITQIEISITHTANLVIASAVALLEVPSDDS